MFSFHANIANVEELLSVPGNLDVSVVKAKFKDNIQPLITIAGNNGLSL
jgi:hypothetical protein